MMTRDSCLTKEQENIKNVRCILKGAFLNSDSELTSLAFYPLPSNLTLPSSLVGVTVLCSPVCHSPRKSARCFDYHGAN